MNKAETTLDLFDIIPSVDTLHLEETLLPREMARTLNLKEHSMGTTNDIDAAIEERATYIRLGRAIFGERRQS